MAQYKVLTPLRTDDNSVHQPGEVIELSDQEAQAAISFKAVEKMKEPVKTDSKPAAPAAPAAPQNGSSTSTTQSPPSPKKADDAK